jgi:hypothetical protein
MKSVRLTAHDASDDSALDAQLVGEFGHRYTTKTPASPDFINLGPRQFSARAVGSDRRAALRSCVTIVVAACPPGEVPPAWQGYATDNIRSLIVIPHTSTDVTDVQDSGVAGDSLSGSALPRDDVSIPAGLTSPKTDIPLTGRFAPGQPTVSIVRLVSRDGTIPIGNLGQVRRRCLTAVLASAGIATEATSVRPEPQVIASAQLADAGDNTLRGATLTGHREPPTRGVKPRDVQPSPGRFMSRIIP